VNTNLMGTPGMQMRTQQVSRSEAGETDKVSLRLPAVTDDCHALSVSRITREGLFDRESVTVDMSPDHHCIPANDATGCYCRAQYPVSPFRPRHDDESGSFLVQPVHDARTLRRRTWRELASPAKERVDESARPVAWCRMNDHTCGLVDDEQCLVLVYDAQRYRFAAYLSGCYGRLVDYDNIAANRPIAGFFAFTVDGNVAVRDQCSRLISRYRSAPGYKQIEANVAVRLDRELMPLAGRQMSGLPDAGAAPMPETGGSLSA